MRQNFLITGANGFVGSALVAALRRQGHFVRRAVRRAPENSDGIETLVVGEVDGQTDWNAALRDIDIVIHLAARVHVMNEVAADPLSEFLKTNLHGTISLAVQAVRAGVRRFIYVSTIKVNGEHAPPDHPFHETDEANPRGPYAYSKWQAEQALHELAHGTGMEIVILRPPLIYGEDVKGNFLRMLQAVDRGIPLPFANAHNARSLLYLRNMVDALLSCATHPAAVGKTYLLRDGEDISVAEMLRLLGAGMGKRARLFPFPQSMLRALASLAGKQESLRRLNGSLCLDDAPIRNELGWQPRFTLRQGLLATASSFRRLHYPTEPRLPARYNGKRQDSRISIVIVNYNAGDILLQTVAQAVQQAEQVIVVDNASKDGSIAALQQAFPQVTVIANETNTGFASACNQGALAAEGDYILFLNPDCILKPGAVGKLIGAMYDQPDVGMVGGMLINPDGSEQGGSRRAIPTPWRSFIRAFGLGRFRKLSPRYFSDFVLYNEPVPEAPVEVEAISGACMMARRDALEDVGLLDEGYFMHCEDLDWCMRFRQRSWRLLFVPDARMVHHKGHCSKPRPIFVEWNKHKGMVRFYNKFFRYRYPGLLMWLVLAAVWMRFAAVCGRYLLQRWRHRPEQDIAE